MGECGCGRVETRVCGMRENKGALTLGNLNRAERVRPQSPVHLTSVIAPFV